MATILDKRRRDREAVQAAKVRRLEDENAALRERELIRESTTEGEDEPAEIPVRSHLQIFARSILTIYLHRLRGHQLHQ